MLCKVLNSIVSLKYKKNKMFFDVSRISPVYPKLKLLLKGFCLFGVHKN